MEEVIILPSLLAKMNDLVDILFNEEYFALKENAVKYVTALIDFAYTIPIRQHYRTIQPKYGQWYCRYQPNKHTTWYITFDTDGTIYLVKNIINNHTKDYPTFIKGMS
ncbi:MAG: hypothetical protein ABIX01_04920 [Chitinophagaceae bacterium]